MNINFDGEVFNAIGNSVDNFAPKYRIHFKPYCDVFILARNNQSEIDQNELLIFVDLRIVFVTMKLVRIDEVPMPSIYG